MFPKLCVLIVVIGGSSVGVLSVRQARLVAANEATAARLEARSLARRTRELRIQITERVTPGALRARLDPAAPLAPSSIRATRLAPLEPAPLSGAEGGADASDGWILYDGTGFRHPDDGHGAP